MIQNAVFLGNMLVIHKRKAIHEAIFSQVAGVDIILMKRKKDLQVILN